MILELQLIGWKHIKLFLCTSKIHQFKLFEIHGVLVILCLGNVMQDFKARRTLGVLQSHHIESFIFAFIQRMRAYYMPVSLRGAEMTMVGKSRLAPTLMGGSLGRTAPIRFAFGNAQPHLF